MLRDVQKIPIEKEDSIEFIRAINKIISLVVFEFRVEEIC